MANLPELITLIGLDLAWGERNADGLCVIRYDEHQQRAHVIGYAYPQGDDELLSALSVHAPLGTPAFLAIDAPIICPNRTGTRPVDRLTHRMFSREHAACHPANSTKCPRPPRILKKLRKLNFEPGWQLSGKAAAGIPRLAAEVYPHPAMVRLFQLQRIVKYKKGLVAARRREFRRLQKLLCALLAAEFPFLALDEDTQFLLRERWTKPVEDHLDAFFCALIGLWHLHHRGRRSEVIGDSKTGFILLPEDLRTVRH